MLEIKPTIPKTVAIILHACVNPLGMTASPHKTPKNTPPTWLKWLVATLSVAIEIPNMMTKDTNNTTRVIFLQKRDYRSMLWGKGKGERGWAGGGGQCFERQFAYLFNAFQLINISVTNIPIRPYIPPLAPTTAMHEPSTTELQFQKKQIVSDETWNFKNINLCLKPVNFFLYNKPTSLNYLPKQRETTLVLSSAIHVQFPSTLPAPPTTYYLKINA